MKSKVHLLSIHSLGLRNFRGFKNVKNVELAPLTFLVGPNSSGKSSLFDALLLVAQSRFGTGIISSGKPTWTDDLVDLGSFQDTVFGHKDHLSIGISIVVDGNLAKYSWWGM